MNERVAVGAMVCVLWSAGCAGHQTAPLRLHCAVPCTRGPEPTGEYLPEDVKGVSAGGSLTCAWSDESVGCWGLLRDAAGSPHVGSATWRFEGVIDASVGSAHVCARTAGKRVKCWGDNEQGQVAPGDERWVPAPRDAGISEAARVVTGLRGTCTQTGATLTCWGWGYPDRMELRLVVEPVNVWLYGAALFVVTETQLLEYRVRSATFELARRLPLPSDVESSSVVLAGSFACGLVGQRHLSCMDLEDGTLKPVKHPAAWRQPVSALHGSPSASWVCALAGEAKAACWYLKDFEYVGKGAGIPAGSHAPALRSLPEIRLTSGGYGFVAAEQISAGYYHWCAVHDGRVSCGGANGCGQLGLPTRIRRMAKDRMPDDPFTDCHGVEEMRGQ